MIQKQFTLNMPGDAISDFSDAHGVTILRTMSGKIHRLDKSYLPMWCVNEESRKKGISAFGKIKSMICTPDFVVVKKVVNKTQKEIYLYAIDVHTGTIEWITPTEKGIPPKTDGNYIITREGDNTLHIDIQTGALIKTTPVIEEENDPKLYSGFPEKANIFILEKNYTTFRAQHTLNNVFYLRGFERDTKEKIIFMIDEEKKAIVHETRFPENTPWWDKDYHEYIIPVDENGTVLFYFEYRKEVKKYHTVCYNLKSNTILWQSEHTVSRSYTVYNDIIWFIDRENGYENEVICSVDKNTGSIEKTSHKAGMLLVSGDYLVNKRLKYYEFFTFNKGQEIISEINSDTPGCPVVKLTDAIKNPRPEGVVKKETFITAVEQARKDGNFDKLYAVMCEVFEIKQVHPAARNYIEQTLDKKAIAGPMHLDGFAVSYKHIAPYHHYFRDETSPRNKLMPGIVIGSLTWGQEYYLFFESGVVIGAHHDSLWSEYFYDIWQNEKKNVEQALKVFTNQYGIMNYNDLNRFITLCIEKYQVNSFGEFGKKIKQKDYESILKEVFAEQLKKGLTLKNIMNSGSFEGFTMEFE